MAGRYPFGPMSRRASGTGSPASTEWAAWLAAVVLFAATAVAGRRFNGALQAQLREAP